jgi:hypothetical protein
MSHAPDTLILRAPADKPARKGDADAARLGLPKDRLGVPCFYYWKSMADADTDYAHPNPKMGTIRFSRKDLTDADRYTKEWIADGGKPFLPMGHGTSGNQGFLKDTKFDGKTLWGLHQFVGETARENAAKHETSVCLRRRFKGGNGKVYPILVEHNALVADPVVMGLPDYVALSRGSGGPADTLPVYTPAAQGTPHMPNAEQLAKAKELLGTPDLADDQVFDVLMSATAVALEDATRFEQENTGLKESVELARRERDDAKRERDDAIELSRHAGGQPHAPAAPSAAEIYYMSRTVAAAKRSVVERRALSPAAVARLEAKLLAGKPVELDKISLSRAVEPDDHKVRDGLAVFADVLEALECNVPTPPVGAATGPQGDVSLSRTGEGAGEGERVNPYEPTIKALTGDAK